MKYTVQSIQNNIAHLIQLNGEKTHQIAKNQKGFDKCQKALNEKLIINFNESGRITTTKTGAKLAYSQKPKTTSKVKANKKFNPLKAITTMAKLNIDADSLLPIKTSSIFDKFMSEEEGFLPGTNIMAAGAPGVGKTTVLLELLYGAQQNGAKCLFISAEMNEMDMARYLKRFPHWKNLNILFLNNFADECPQQVVESTINLGWDLILTDSYTEVNDTVKEACNLTRSKVEKWFLQLMTDNNKAKNKQKIHTTFVTILQLSKGGTFVGSNKLKHMTSAMMNIQWEGNENSGNRFMEFTKNRCGQVNQKLYYTLGAGVELDGDRYYKEMEYRKLLNEEVDNSSFEWDDIFGKHEMAEVKTESQEV